VQVGERLFAQPFALIRDGHTHSVDGRQIFARNYLAEIPAQSPKSPRKIMHFTELVAFVETDVELVLHA